MEEWTGNEKNRLKAYSTEDGKLKEQETKSLFYSTEERETKEQAKSLFYKRTGNQKNRLKAYFTEEQAA